MAIPGLSLPTLRRYSIALLWFCLVALVAPFSPPPPPALARPVCDAGAIGGIVYNDFNANGLRDGIEPGVGGIQVAAYDPFGAVIATTATDAQGEYLLRVPAGPEVRVEFANLPPGYQPGPHGPNSRTTVTFARGGDCGVDLSILRPGQYCQRNPDVITSCYVFGDQTMNEGTLFSFPYESGTTSLTDSTGVDQPARAPEATDAQVGATWGLAYQRGARNVYAAAFMKRHVGFGPAGTGAIYRIDRSTRIVSLFLDLNALFPGSAGPDAHDRSDYIYDIPAWPWVGKTSLGDIDLSDDGLTLWVMNLYDRKLYEVPIGNPPVAPPASQIARHTLPDPGTGPTGCPRDPATPVGELNRDLRPHALKIVDPIVYVGMVCTAESIRSSSIATDTLRAFVYALDTRTDQFTQVANFPLNYPRGCVTQRQADCANAEWRPWSPTAASLEYFTPYDQYYYPQPWLTDIEFDEYGFMIVGIGDRMGHQTGNKRADPFPIGAVEGVSAGDLLRLAPVPGGWQLENNGTSGGVTTGGANTGQGPGGGEFYFHERYKITGGRVHDEISLGGLALLLGRGEIVESAFDPPPTLGVRTGGVIWLSNTTGQRTRSYQLFAADAWGSFGKAAGVGDLELMCDRAPLEIGNRVWLDLDKNGIQDPGEEPIPGVTVRLYRNGQLVGTTTTNALGEYYFPVEPNTVYEVRLDNPADYEPGGPLYKLDLTPANQGADQRDSDGIPIRGFPTIGLVTGGPGANNHTYDFGFNRSGTTAIQLERFSATLEDSAVVVSWTTSAEIDTWGFHLYRSADGRRASAARVTPELILGRGRDGGATYSWTDRHIAPGATYTYWLQEIELDNDVNEYGPAIARPAFRSALFIPLFRR